MLPIHVVDQGLIARTFVERGAGVEFTRDEEDRYYSSESVAESVLAVMGEESGRRYRDKAEEMRVAVFGNTAMFWGMAPATEEKNRVGIEKGTGGVINDLI
ncbi:unnamed protein product [Linum tenue]|uniref:Uncharacterized protein n=1 Tax=Linum tenue TaxID=586396 RepID=A0AAV0IV53_9ROSI|nr:unnamed protein product [Linum tenue]